MEYEIQRRIYKVSGKGALALTLPIYFGFKSGDVVTLEYDSKNENVIKIVRS